MKVDYIALSIPIFFILIGIEFWIGVRKKLKIYRLNDSLANISLGIGQQVTGVFMKSALFFGYLYLYENYRVMSIESSLLNWFLLFLGVDFFYYWFHRLSHEVNALWAAHIVHHQSEEYNLSVALRQSWFQSAFSWVFYLPLAWVGFDPIMFLTISSFNTLYQFWIHTRLIGNMGPLEWIFNTPSHHRVHHGSDPRYIDKNHGGTLIIWDKMFGTFQREIKEPHYGITTPLNSFNPVWANFHYWLDLFRWASLTKGIKNKLLVFTKPPGWFPSDLGGFQAPKEIDDSTYSKYDAKPVQTMSKYAFFQFTIALLVSVLILFLQSSLTFAQLILTSVYILVTIMNVGGIFDLKKWTGYVEIARILSAPALVWLFSGLNEFYLILTFSVVYTMVSFIWFTLSRTVHEKAMGI
jgi:alkylglycerol monooxygenase